MVTDSSTDLRCTCFRLRRAARKVTQAYDTALQEAGVSAVQFALLVEIDRSAPATVNHLAERLGTDRTTLSRTLTRLSQWGWIVDRQGSDKRAHGFSLTDDGRRTLFDAGRHWQRAEAAMVRAVGPKGIAQLYELLEKSEEVGTPPVE